MQSKHSNRPLSLFALYRMTLAAAGQQAAHFKRSILLGTLTAVLRGAAFVCFVPLFNAVNATQWQSVWTWLISISVLLLLSSISDWISRDFDYSGRVALAGDELRRRLGQHMRRIPLQTLYRSRSGELNTTIAGTVDDVINHSQTVVLMLLNAVVIPMVVGLGVLFFDWRLGLALLILFPAVLPIYFAMRPLLNSNKQELIEASAHLNAETLEYTQGLAVLKSAGCIGEKSLRFNQAADAMEHAQRQAQQEELPANMLLASIVEIGTMLIVGLGLWLLSNGDISLMLLAGLMVALVRFAEPLSVFLSMMGIFELVSVGYQRLDKLLAIQPLAEQTPLQTPTQFSVQLNDLSFAYEGTTEKVLNNINLNIPANALTALVGSSGCGKTTLVRMLMRYADPQSGSVKIGDVDIKSIAIEQLNQLIAVVFQDVYLFDDTILANIRMGRSNATDDEVYAAAKAAHCHEFIKRLPDGYQTRVGDIGGNLSGGEKQRISIARALLKDAPIVILDEPTAALDVQSEVAVQRAIDALVKNKTVIVIAHRLSTIVAAQQIVVMDKGSIIETDTHENLLASNGRYAKLWQMQHGTNR